MRDGLSQINTRLGHHAEKIYEQLRIVPSQSGWHYTTTELVLISSIAAAAVTVTTISATFRCFLCCLRGLRGIPGTSIAEGTTSGALAGTAELLGEILDGNLHE